MTHLYLQSRNRQQICHCPQDQTPAQVQQAVPVVQGQV